MTCEVFSQSTVTYLTWLDRWISVIHLFLVISLIASLWKVSAEYDYVKPSNDTSSLSLFYESMPNFLLTGALLYDLLPDDLSDLWFLRPFN